MKLLAIGNSFSQDATAFLAPIARAGGFPLRAVNLCIGGCSLRQHWANAVSGERAYALEVDGRDTGEPASLQDTLGEGGWDWISIQQASHFSFDYGTYQPYGRDLYDFLRKEAPGAEVFIHQTWAYEAGSERLREVAGFFSAADMLCCLREAYSHFSRDTGGLRILPAGELLCFATLHGLPVVHRDTFHASIPNGRYLLAGLWYLFLSGKATMQDSDYRPEGMAEGDFHLCREILDAFWANYRQ